MSYRSNLFTTGWPGASPVTGGRSSARARHRLRRRPNASSFDFKWIAAIEHFQTETIWSWPPKSDRRPLTRPQPSQQLYYYYYYYYYYCCCCCCCYYYCCCYLFPFWTETERKRGTIYFLVACLFFWEKIKFRIGRKKKKMKMKKRKKNWENCLHFPFFSFSLSLTPTFFFFLKKKIYI